MLSQQILLRTSRLRFKIRKESLQISKDSSSPESNSKMAEPSPITTSKRSQPFISSSDLEVECKSSSRPSLERPSLLMLSQQTPLRTSKPRSKTKKVFLQISKDSSLPESNLKTVELSPITTSKRSQPSISSSDLEVECKFSSRPSLERPLPSTLSQQIPSRTSRLRSKTRKESLQISKDSSSPESNLKTAELSLTTTSKRSLLSILFSDLEEECRSSSRPSLERPSLLMSSQQTLSRTSKPRFKIRKESHQISKDSSSLENNLKTAELFQTTTFKKNPLFILSLDSEEETEILFI